MLCSEEKGKFNIVELLMLTCDVIVLSNILCMCALLVVSPRYVLCTLCIRPMWYMYSKRKAQLLCLILFLLVATNKHRAYDRKHNIAKLVRCFARKYCVYVCNVHYSVLHGNELLIYIVHLMTIAVTFLFVQHTVSLLPTVDQREF